MIEANFRTFSVLFSIKNTRKSWPIALPFTAFYYWTCSKA